MLDDPEDDLTPSAGILRALCACLVLWALIGALVLLGMVLCGWA